MRHFCVFICDSEVSARSPGLSPSKDHVYDIVLSLNKMHSNAMRCLTTLRMAARSASVVYTFWTLVLPSVAVVVVVAVSLCGG